MQRALISLLLSLILALSLLACAGEPLTSAGPAGVNLSGRWKYNPDLSDEAERPADADKNGGPSASGSRRRGNRTGPGGAGVPPIGSSGGDRWRSGPGVVLGPDGSAEPGRMLKVDLPAAPPEASSMGSGGRISRLLPAATYLLIEQQGTRVSIKASMPDGTVTSEDFIAGQKATVPLANGTAERLVGWRGPVLVVITKGRQGGEIENDYALDEYGKLIVATELRAGHMKKPVDIKRVYDRVDRSESGK